MAPSLGKVLVVDDDEAMCDLLERGLGRRGYAVETTTSPTEALRRIEQEEWDVVLTDLHMGELDGFAVCREASRLRKGMPVVVITAFGDIDKAVAAIRAGAYDFITKPFALEVVALALDRAIDHYRATEAVGRLRHQVEGEGRFEGLVGTSKVMRRVFDLLGRVSGSEATVLITGESGTGKELCAEAIHRRSRRAAGPFVALNCAALPESLLESELFGHAKGAFTDARSARVGLLVQADGGTLFLDEIGEMPLSMQAKLLRALQERVVRPVGAEGEVPYDARIIAATNRDPQAAVETGAMRGDLYYRLNVIQIDLPPLRVRGRDVLLLASQMVEESAEAAVRGVRGIAPEAAELLLVYTWPGNVRELQNCVDRAVVLARGERVEPDDLPDKVREYSPATHVVVASHDPTDLISLEELERRYILRVLDVVGGQKTAASKILGVDRKTLARKLKQWSKNSQGRVRSSS